MTDDKLLTLARRIQERTKEGSLRWEATARENTFQVAFPGSVVQISSWPDSRGREVYTLRVLNAEGLVLEDITESTLQSALAQSPHTSEEFFELPSPADVARRILEESYIRARRIALGTDSTLDSLLTFLGGKSGK